jgi:hypothetical protein
MKYTFICEHYGGMTHDRLVGRVTVETEHDGLPELIEKFEDFLRGCGMPLGQFEYLEVINEDELQ